jgi:hypothetical protein
MRRLILLLLLVAAPAFAQGRITDAEVRAFVARQEQAWNSARLDAYFTGFTADATFTDQAYQGGKPAVPYGTSTLAEARTQTVKAFAKARSREAGRVFRVEIAGNGASARVTTSVGMQNGPRRLCASRVQTLVLAAGGLKSKGQTDTYIRCRGG